MTILDDGDGRPYGILARHPHWQDHLLAVECLPSEVAQPGPVTTGSGPAITFPTKDAAQMTAELWEVLWGRVGWKFTVVERRLVPRWYIANPESPSERDRAFAEGGPF